MGRRFKLATHPVEEVAQSLELAALAGLEGAQLGVDALDTALDQGEVGEGELEVHDADVAAGVDGALGVGNGLVLEGAHDMDERIDGGQLVQEAPAEALSLAEVLARGGEVDVLDGGVGRLLRLVDLGEAVNARVWDGHGADVGLARAAEAPDGGESAGDGVEDGRLARPR